MKKDINKKGFVLLFTALLASVVLSVALGTANIAFKQILFSAGAEETVKAFYSADVGAECALFLGKNGVSGGAGGESGSSSSMTSFQINCAGGSSNVSVDTPDENTRIQRFSIDRLGFEGDGCADIEITENLGTFPITGTIISTGYNKGGSYGDVCEPDEISVSRQIELVY